MKNKMRRLNFILAMLLVIVLGMGCGKQKAVELPAGDEAVLAVSEDTIGQVQASEDKTERLVESPETTEDKTENVAEEQEVTENKTDSSFEEPEPIADKTNSSGDSAGSVGSSEFDEPESGETVTSVIFVDGIYTSKEDVARYISEFGHLPQNFITKKEAQALGWPGGSLEKYAPGKCIGGDRFGNYEGLLPEEKGRKYYECDIDTLGKDKRGAKRIIYSNDGLIFYTDDHYKSFTQLYGLGFDD